MEAKDLRIGNWVKRSVVLDMLHEQPYAIVDTVMIRDCEYYKDNWAFEPIPLTSEVLEACGFAFAFDWSDVLTIPIKYQDENYPCTLQNQAGNDHISVCRSGIYAISVKCEYLHQLQNLYFALTGSELEVSLPLIGNSPIRDNK